jgi:amidase
MLEGGVRGLKVALVREGFSHSQSEPDGDEKVRKAAELLGKLGATITAVSIPWHLLGRAIFFPGEEGWSTLVHRR